MIIATCKCGARVRFEKLTGKYWRHYCQMDAINEWTREQCMEAYLAYLGDVIAHVEEFGEHGATRR